METTHPDVSPAIRAGGSVLQGTARETLYEILNVSPQATKNEIRESYVRLKSAFAGGGQALYSLMSEEQAQAALAKIEEAFRLLNDDQRRHLYDSGPAQNSLQGSVHLASSSKTSGSPAQTRVVSTKVDAAQIQAAQSRVQEIIEAGDPADGDLFRSLREAMGVSEAEMQHRTKVTSTYLTAMESNQFERLPQAVFVKGFLKSYLQYLGVKDMDRLANAYAERLRNWQIAKKT